MIISESISALKSIFDVVSRVFARLREERQQKDSKDLASRFLRIHREHEVLPIQIPRVLGIEQKLKPNDVLNQKQLLERLDNEMLDATCDLYGVRREWLDGENISPYQNPFFYGMPLTLVSFLEELTARHSVCRLWCFKSEGISMEKLDNGDLYAIIVADNFVLGDRIIERFYPLHSDWPWHHYPARLDFKALVYICWHLKIYPIGREVPAVEIQKVRNNINFPSALCRFPKFRRWHPDDYIFTSDESQAAKNFDEALALKNWLDEAGVLKRLPQNP